MRVSNDFRLVPTRLKPISNSWYALAFVATSLQPDNETIDKFPRPLDTQTFYLKNQAEDLLLSSGSISSTIIEKDFTTFFSQFNGTVLQAEITDDIEISEDDFTIRPNYIDDFKIKVNTFKIDDSLPKIFID